MLRQNSPVVAIFVEVVRNQKEGAVPGWAVAPFVTPAARRHDARKFAARLLFIAQVVDPLGIDGGRRVVEQGLLRGQVRVTRPAVFLSMRAIGRDALEIA